MNKTFSLTALLVMAFVTASALHAEDRVMTREQIIADGEAMADLQLTKFAKKTPPPDWEMGVLWAGFADFSKVSPKPAYRDALRKSGELAQWKLIYNPRWPHHADDLCIGQAWLDLYAETKKPGILADLKARVDGAADYLLSLEKLPVTAYSLDKIQPADRVLAWSWEWSWCDALFMAPSVVTRLGVLTEDPKYVHALHIGWGRTTQVLYDENEHLFFRDRKKLTLKSKNGHKVFWARGNGWVLGGYARMLEYLPKDDPARPRYETQLRDIATRLAILQRPDGTWSPSLLDFDEFPFSESSGTALNCFAMAWGINHGLLDEKTFRPVVEKAWAALLAARRTDGLLGYVQGVAHGPAAVYADGNRTYGTGAFLMAAAQLAQLAPLHLPPAPQLTAASLKK